MGVVKVKAKVKAEKGKAAKEKTMTPSITSKKVLNTILKKEKVNGKEKDQKVKKVEKVEKVEKVKALRVMEKTPNTTLKEKVVEKVKVTGDPKKTGKENPKEEKNTTLKEKVVEKVTG